MDDFFLGLFLSSFFALIIGLIKPSFFIGGTRIKNTVISLIVLAASILLFIKTQVDEPANALVTVLGMFVFPLCSFIIFLKGGIYTEGDYDDKKDVDDTYIDTKLLESKAIEENTPNECKLVLNKNKLMIQEVVETKQLDIPIDPVERNAQGHKLEKEGDIENAIEFYKANVTQGFRGAFPYKKLSIIYRNRKEYELEIQVLEKAVEVFSSLVIRTNKQDVADKLIAFKKRLAEARTLYVNHKSLDE